jgi:cytochrome P450
MTNSFVDAPVLPRPPAPLPREAPLRPLASLWVLGKNPIETWTRFHFEEPIIVGPTVLGMVAVVSEPAAIRHLLVDNAANYCRDRLQRRVLGAGLGNGLFLAEGEEWRVQRRTLAPLFTPKTVAGFAAATNDAAKDLVARWLRRREGRIFDIQPEMARVTLDILGRTIFSDGLGSDPAALTDALSRYFLALGRLDPFDLLNLPDWVPRLTKLTGREALSVFDNMLDIENLVARRKALLAQNETAAPRDILTLLLKAEDPRTGAGLSSADVRDNITTFISAGHETTANALIWSLFLLSLSEEWRLQLAAEADAVLPGPVASYAEKLIKTRAVIEEALRLYPPAASISREAIDTDSLGGRRIRKGTLVIVSQWVLHRHKLLWSEPDLFDPRRFMPGAREQIDRFAYLPFGAGPRICIGATFALQEAAIILAHIMRSFTLGVQKGYAVKPVQRITLRPEGGLPMILRHRGRP